jgi:MFS family permease
MVYEERNTWATLIATVLTSSVYVFVILRQLGATPVEEIDWVTPMLWTIGVSIVAAIVISILLGIVSGIRDGNDMGRTDQRDRDISRLGDRVGQAFLMIGALGALVLCMIEADWFWIGNSIYFGFALSALLACIVRVVVYRRGMP